MNTKGRFLTPFLLCILVTSSAAAHNHTSFDGSGWRTPKLLRSAMTFRPSVINPADVSTAPITPDVMTSTILSKLTGDSALRVARTLGLNSLGGKKFSNGVQADLDNIVSASNVRNENEPSMAVNPQNEQIAVIFNHSYDDSLDDPCLATVSYNGGDTWDSNNRVTLPVLNGGDFCSDPVVRFSPDGAYVYYTYLNIAASVTTSQLVVQKADGNDPADLIDSPVVALDLGSGVFLDKDWADVHTHDVAVGGTDSGVLYVTATAFYPADCGIVMNVSFDYGATWYYSTGSGITLDFSSGCARVIQGTRPIGGNGHFFMACWYDSSLDGFRAAAFFIDCVADDLNGTGTGPAGFSPYFFPGSKRQYELAEWLGPNFSYHRWWGAMFPSLAIDESGMAYVGFTQDPTSSQIDIEAGNVYVGQHFLNSTVTGAWPVVGVGTGSTAQGYVTLAAHFDPALNRYNLYAAYYDHTASNKLYNTVFRKGTRSPTGKTLSYGNKVKVSDRTSLSDFLFIGDYFDSAITARRYHVAWTDRADAYSIFDEDDDILHDVFVQ